MNMQQARWLVRDRRGKSWLKRLVTVVKNSNKQIHITVNSLHPKYTVNNMIVDTEKVWDRVAEKA